MAAGLIGFGMHILLWPSTMATSRYSGATLILGITGFGLVCAVIGMLRLVTLARNGQWPEWGPRVRAGCAVASGVIILQLAVSLAANKSPGLWIYIALAGAELRSVFRARRDANGPRYQ